MNDMLVDVALNFVLKRIVFVNSASHAYSEIMLDEHLALFGANNAGKTASLAATKLMLYPETDFSSCDKKFQFKGKAGTYSKEDSYEFYFPSDKSFLAMEIENDLGTSCVVLYRAGSYRYYRVFLPLPYEVVRPLFWNTDTHNFAEDININKLLAFNKKHNGIHVNDDKRLVELMYHNFARDDSRYCIVPLSDNNKNAVNAFRNIYQMAFDAGTGDSESLADAIATLVEMKRSRPQEKMSADLASLEADYYQLIQKGEELQILNNNKERYAHIKSSFEHLNAKSMEIGKQHAILSRQLTKQKSTYTSCHQQASQDLSEAQSAHQVLSNQYNDLDKKQNQLAGVITQLKNTLDATNQQIVTAQQVMSEHDNTNADELYKSLNDDHQQLAAEQAALSDSEQTAQMLTQMVSQQNHHRQQLDKKKTQAQNIHSLLLSQVSPHTADVLVSLNADFADVAMNLTDAHHRVLDDFANFFTTDSDLLAFENLVLSNTQTQAFNAEEQATQLRQDIEELEKKIINIDKKIKEINLTMADSSGESRRNRLTEIAGKIATLDTHLNALKRFDIAMEDLGKYRAELTDKQQSQQAISDELKELELQKRQTSQRLNQAQSKKQQLEENSSKFEFYDTGLKQISKATNHQYYSEEDIESYEVKYVQTHNGNQLELDVAQINKLIAEAGDLVTEQAYLKSEVIDFTKEVPNERVDTFKEIQNLVQMGQIVDAYNTSFTTLAYQQNVQTQQIAEHNNIISNQLKEISDAHQLLTDSIATINKELNTHKISNLDQVRLKLHRHADFNHVYKLYQSYDVTQTKLMGREFYQSLISYVDKHASKRTGLLKMRDIISKISFEYQKSDGTITDKSQSGGTTSTITASIIAILLGRIFMPNSSFKMPIIIDEIGDLDDTNTKTIIECIGQHGFSAFCATPTQRTSVCQSVKRWIHVDYNVLEHVPQVADCVLNIMPEAINFWGAQDDSSSELDLDDESVSNHDRSSSDNSRSDSSKPDSSNKESDLAIHRTQTSIDSHEVS